MPSKRSKNHPKTRNKYPKSRKEPIADAMADCVLPEEMMLCILTRLPVKSLLRFRCVCKPWRKLFSTPEFMKMHIDQFSGDPKNQDFIVSGSSGFDNPTMSLFSIECNDKKPTNLNLDHPYSKNIVGCCNGLLCMYDPPFGEGIVLWNPALKLLKFVRLSGVDFGVPDLVSVGFGYDAEGDDFKVVRIVCLEGEDIKSGVEVYSAKSDSWKTIEVDFPLDVLMSKNEAIVSGNPYWIGRVVEKGSVESCLLWFDVKRLLLSMVPVPRHVLEEREEELFWPQFVDWKGSLAAIVCSKNKESVNVWVFDEAEMIWRLNHTFGPVEMDMSWCLHCSKNGKIIGACPDRKLFVFVPETGCVKVIEMDQPRKSCLEINGYSESLAYIKGMEPLVDKKEEEEEKKQILRGRRLHGWSSNRH